MRVGGGALLIFLSFSDESCAVKAKTESIRDLEFISKYFVFSGSSCSLMLPYYSTVSLYFNNG